MRIPTNLNLAQTLEGMPLTFDPEAAEDGLPLRLGAPAECQHQPGL